MAARIPAEAHTGHSQAVDSLAGIEDCILAVGIVVDIVGTVRQ